MIKKVLIPSDTALFKQKLLTSKKAKRILLYRDGSAKVEEWNASSFAPDSDLMRNISSQLGHRKDREEIVEAIYEVDDSEFSNNNSNNETDIDGELYIHYQKGWSSFRPVGEHVSEYTINNSCIKVTYEVGFGPGKTISKTISPSNMRELLNILNQAIKISALGKSNTAINTIHGNICTYDYDYRNHFGNNCNALILDEILSTRYRDLIDKII